MTARWVLHEGHAEDAYPRWGDPDLIVSDGAYGVGGFPGDPHTADELPGWYEPHVAVWSQRAHPATTLWLWNTELGWATVHPLLTDNGWEHVQTVVWDKGVAHVAGNVNSRTIRRLPTVTEVCGFYRRHLRLPAPDGRVLAARDWLRGEWQRTGLPLNDANTACGVRSAATRKYLARDWQWYLPPPEVLTRLAEYANTHGNPDGRPYFSVDGKRPVTAAQWARLRHPWHHQHGLTNVWPHPPLHGAERQKSGTAAAHLNQKPLALMRRIVDLASDPGNTVWEPFGGLCTVSVAAVTTGRNTCAAEPDPRFAALARQRLSAAVTDAGTCGKLAFSSHG